MFVRVWVGIVGVIALIQGLRSVLQDGPAVLTMKSKLYVTHPAQTTTLACHLAGIWNITSAMVRLYTVLHWDCQPLFDLCMGTFIVAILHFTTEATVFGHTRLSAPGILAALSVASFSLIAMVFVRN